MSVVPLGKIHTLRQDFRRACQERAQRQGEHVVEGGRRAGGNPRRWIAALDTGTSLFFNHRDPAQVSRLGRARID